MSADQDQNPTRCLRIDVASIPVYGIEWQLRFNISPPERPSGKIHAGRFGYMEEV